MSGALVYILGYITAPLSYYYIIIMWSTAGRNQLWQSFGNRLRGFDSTVVEFLQWLTRSWDIVLRPLRFTSVQYSSERKLQGGDAWPPYAHTPCIQCHFSSVSTAFLYSHSSEGSHEYVSARNTTDAVTRLADDAKIAVSYDRMIM